MRCKIVTVGPLVQLFLFFHNLVYFSSHFSLFLSSFLALQIDKSPTQKGLSFSTGGISIMFLQIHLSSMLVFMWAGVWAPGGGHSKASVLHMLIFAGWTERVWKTLSVHPAANGYPTLFRAGEVLSGEGKGDGHNPLHAVPSDTCGTLTFTAPSANWLWDLPLSFIRGC